jgi:hypothetical protein
MGTSFPVTFLIALQRSIARVGPTPILLWKISEIAVARIPVNVESFTKSPRFQNLFDFENFLRILFSPYREKYEPII